MHVQFLMGLSSMKLIIVFTGQASSLEEGGDSEGNWGVQNGGVRGEWEGEADTAIGGG